MSLSLSPTLFAICNRSGTFRRRFRRDQLNVCNVVRSLVYVMLVWNVLMPTLAFLLAHSAVQLVYVMIINGFWDPFKATDVIIEASKIRDTFDWTSVSQWVTVTSMCLSCVVAAVGFILTFCVPALLAIYYGWLGLSKLLKANATGEAIETVLSPLNIGFEWIAARHNKFCVNISSQVRTKTPYTAFLEAAHKEDLMMHTRRLRHMSIKELTASVEATRNTLANFKL